MSYLSYELMLIILKSRKTLNNQSLASNECFCYLNESVVIVLLHGFQIISFHVLSLYFAYHSQSILSAQIVILYKVLLLFLLLLLLLLTNLLNNQIFQFYLQVLVKMLLQLICLILSGVIRGIGLRKSLCFIQKRVLILSIVNLSMF